MGRAPCCEKVGLKRGPWTAQEDQILINFINLHGHANWRKLPKLAGLLRCGKSCRLRWINYLRPDIKRGNFTKEEEDTIIKLHQELGNKWSDVAAKLPGRTDNEIKNVWNTHLKKRLLDDDHNQSPKTKKRSRKSNSKSNKNTDDQENTKPSTEMQNSSPSNSSVDDHDTINIVAAAIDDQHGMITSSSSASSSTLISDTVNKLMEMEDIDVISAHLSCIISNAIADDDHAFEFDSNMNMNMHDDDVEFWYNIYTKDEGQLEELLMDLF